MSSVKATGYLLSDVVDKPRGSEAIISASTAPNDICPTVCKPARMSTVGIQILASVTDYLYREAQECRTTEERDAFSLALAICGAVRRGDTNPLISAGYSAFGSTLERHLKRRSHRQWLQHQELLRCIPDYDARVNIVPRQQQIDGASNANVEQASEVRRQETRVGNLYEMPPLQKRPQQKPVREVPRKSAAD
jgi:hypothetical protein